MEWTAVTVLAAIAGLGVTVGGPVVRLNSSITRLTALLQAMERRLDALEAALAAQQSKAARKPPPPVDPRRGSRTAAWPTTRRACSCWKRRDAEWKISGKT